MWRSREKTVAKLIQLSKQMKGNRSQENMVEVKDFKRHFQKTDMATEKTIFELEGHHNSNLQIITIGDQEVEAHHK